jgi:hypothetical protein
MTFDLPAVQTNIRAFITAVRDQAANASAAEQASSSSGKKRKRESPRLCTTRYQADE